MKAMFEFKSSQKVNRALNELLEQDSAEGFRNVVKGVFYNWLTDYDSTMKYRAEVTLHFDYLLTFLEKINEIEKSEIMANPLK